MIFGATSMGVFSPTWNACAVWPYHATPAFTFGLCAAYMQHDAPAPAEAGDAEARRLRLAAGLRERDARVEVGHHLRVRHLRHDLRHELRRCRCTSTGRPGARRAPARSRSSRPSQSRRQTSLMCSCTPKTSCTTSTTGKLPPVAGIARYAGISPSLVLTFTSPATRPSAEVVIVCADTGITASCKARGERRHDERAAIDVAVARAGFLDGIQRLRSLLLLRSMASYSWTTCPRDDGVTDAPRDLVPEERRVLALARKRGARPSTTRPDRRRTGRQARRRASVAGRDRR